MKYHILNGRVSVIQGAGDFQKYYAKSLELKKVRTLWVNIMDIKTKASRRNSRKIRPNRPKRRKHERWRRRSSIIKWKPRQWNSFSLVYWVCFRRVIVSVVFLWTMTFSWFSWLILFSLLLWWSVVFMRPSLNLYKHLYYCYITCMSFWNKRMLLMSFLEVITC